MVRLPYLVVRLLYLGGKAAVPGSKAAVPGGKAAAVPGGKAVHSGPADDGAPVDGDGGDGEGGDEDKDRLEPGNHCSPHPLHQSIYIYISSLFDSNDNPVTSYSYVVREGALYFTCNAFSK